MAEYTQKALKQASHEATVLFYSPGIDYFMEDLAKGVDQYSTSKKGLEKHRG